MRSNTSRVGEIADIVDSLHKTPKYSATGWSMVRATDVKYGPLHLDQTYKVDDEVYAQFARRYKPSIGDIVITRVGSYGNTAYVQDVNFCLGQNTTAIIPKINARYLFLALNSPQLKYQIDSLVVGSTQKTLSLKAISNLEIPRFDLKTEDFIADVCGQLDDKIQLNNQINQTLEQMAQEIFKSWFVDFEPTRAKIAALEAGGSEDDALLAAMQTIAGSALFATDAADTDAPTQLARLQAEHPEQYTTLRATAELFPSAMQESELGEIPEGWGTGSFKDLCLTVESGGTPKRNTPEYWGGKIKWLASGEVRDVVVLDTKETITESGLKNSSAKLWPMYTTVVAMYGATAGQVCLIADQMTSNQACCGLIPKKNYKAFTFFSAKRSIQSLSDKASGSAQQNLNKGLVEGHQTILPAETILVIYEELAFPLMLKWIENMRESVMLAETRDTLLPKLLSGEIDVSALADNTEANA